MSFVTMPDLQTGQVLSAESLNRFRRNAEYLYALEAFGQPVFRMVPGGSNSATTTAIWSGRMRHWSANLGYSVRVQGTPGASPSFTIQIEIASVWTTVKTQSGLAADTTYEGAVDLTAVAGLTKGTIYPVRVNSTNAIVEINRLFTYGSLPAAQGGYEWQAWGSFADGAVPTAAELNRFANNLRYLHDQLAGPWTPTHAAMGAALSKTDYANLDDDVNRLAPQSIWTGWVQHRSDYAAYQIGGWPADSAALNDHPVSIVYVNPNTAAPPVATFGNPLGIAYDWASGNILWGSANTRPPADPNTDTTGDFLTSGYVANPPHTVRPYLARISTSTDNNLATPGFPLASLVKGTWYQIRCMRHDFGGTGGQNITAACQVVYEVGGTPDPTGWTTIAAFTHGEYVDGTSSKLANLKANIDLLKTRIDNYPHLLCPYGDDLYFVRRGDVLLWGGTNVTLHHNKGRWPERGLSESTITLGTETGVGVFDLRSLSGHVHGGLYYVTGTNVWALEVLG